MRFKLTALLLLILVIPLAVTAIDEPNDITNHWAQDYILNVINRGTMKIYPDGTFRPEQPVTRGEFAKALSRELGLLPDSITSFKDLEGYPGYTLITPLVKEKIFKGYPDGTFRPEKPLSRAEAVVILLKSLGIMNEEQKINLSDQPSFKDVPENHWAANFFKNRKENRSY